jgi:copper chaperone CopZ
MKMICIDVKGMHCPSCETLIKEGLEELAGVKSAAVSHKTGKVVVEFDEKKTSEKEIKQVVRGLKYQVH